MQSIITQRIAIFADSENVHRPCVHTLDNSLRKEFEQIGGRGGLWVMLAHGRAVLDQYVSYLKWRKIDSLIYIWF